MAIAAVAPLLWGVATNNIKDSIWITLAAECIGWVELKGSFAWQVRTLMTGAALTVLFSALGAMTGNIIWLSTLLMFVVGYLSSLLRNLGDRASGLAICVYLMFIISNAYPTDALPAVEHRTLLVIEGAVWTIFVGLAAVLFKPVQQPFRRQMALVWKSISSLVSIVAKGWDVKDLRGSIREIYLKEKDVRNALDNSFLFYQSMAYQVKEQDSQYHLTQIRKATALVATHVVAISEEMEGLKIKDIDNPLRLKMSSLFHALEQTTDRMAFFVVALRPEDELLVVSNLNRLKKLVILVRQYPPLPDESKTKSLARILLLTERATKLIENVLNRLEQLKKDKSIIRSYSLIKTLFILNPKYLLNDLRILTNINTFTTRFALRTAIASTVALFIYKWFHIDHGYWLPFSVMIIIQPYFNATYKKAMDRVIGTLLGGLTGSLFLFIPTALHLREVILFFTFVLMVYYLRKNYAIAAFVITINLILLFHIEDALHPLIIVIRAACTLGGAAIAVGTGYLLLPTWDKKWLPVHFADAVKCNYLYFISTFYSDKPIVSWTRNKRSAESKNSNVFDSFNRYMQEPSSRKKSTLYYDLTTYNVRITRDLNNIHIDQDERTDKLKASPATDAQQKLIDDCLSWFNRTLQTLSAVNPNITKDLYEYRQGFHSPFQLSDNQTVYIEKLLIELKTMYQDIEKIAGEEHVE